MKLRLIHTAFALLTVTVSSAQWKPLAADHSGPIYYTGGNVGIGTTSPNAPLHVSASGDGKRIVLSDEGTSDQYMGFGYHTNILRYQSPSTTGDHVFYAATSSTTSSELLRIKGNGNVGIWNNSPNASLDVKYKDASTNLYRATDQNGQQRWRVDQLFDMYMTNAQGVEVAKLGQGISWVRYGDFGIGTISPDGLQVNSVLSQETSRGVTNVRIGMFGNTPTPRIILDQAGQATFEIDNSEGKLRFFTPGIELMVINSNGNVGIGTNQPDAKLAVKGNIHAWGLDLDLEGAMIPDYVFEKNYNLLPLNEVENYVNEHKHLPEVPSAAEMQKTGMDVKEMNLLLLKKVEELTLYMIDLKKENEKQDAIIKKLLEEKK